MNETLQKIRQETLERLKAAKDESEIESLSVSVFGKSGSLTEILKSMGKLSKEERASVGQSVKAGDVLVVLEAMKMENEIMAPCDGTVTSVSVTKGAAVESGTLLCTIG